MTAIPRKSTRLGVVLATTALAALPIIGAQPAHAAEDSLVCTPICVLDTRTASHANYDRLVFDLSEGTLPNVRVEANSDGSYTPPSGETKYIETPGDSYLILDVYIAHITSDDGTPAYTSPRVQAVDLPSLKGIELLSAAEGYVQFGLSLGSSSSYKTFTLSSPNRLVVDIYH